MAARSTAASVATPTTPTTPVATPQMRLSPIARLWMGVGFSIAIIVVVGFGFYVASSHAHWDVSFWLGFGSLTSIALLILVFILGNKDSRDNNRMWLGNLVSSIALVLWIGLEFMLLSFQNHHAFNAGGLWMGLACTLLVGVAIGLHLFSNWLSSRVKA